jgi:hypothetical protein
MTKTTRHGRDLSIGQALAHADSMAPPSDRNLIIVPKTYEVHARSSRALGVLAAEVRSLQRRLRAAQRGGSVVAPHSLDQGAS